MCRRLAVDETIAEREIVQSDAAHAHAFLRFFSTDWRARYMFEFQLPPAEEILAWRIDRSRRRSHPVDAGVSLEQVKRQVAVYREAAIHFHRSGILTYVRDAIEGTPKYIRMPAQQSV